MAKQPYHWLVALTAACWNPPAENPGPADSRQIKDVYAQAGTFTHAETKSANDLFILALIAAIYLANLHVICAIPPKSATNKKGLFSRPHQATTLALQALPEKTAFFWTLLILRQINSSPTLILRQINSSPTVFVGVFFEI